jgi:hypothetical protein
MIALLAEGTRNINAKPYPFVPIIFLTTIDIKSFYKDKKQNNLVYNINNYMTMQRYLFGSRPIKTLSRSMRLDNLVHDTADFDIRIIFIPVFKGANFP